MSSITNLDAGDEAWVGLQVSGGARTVGLEGSFFVSAFSGALIC